jgi:4-carboxymuconolactone decarboxylase
MTRLTPLTRDDLGEEATALWDTMIDTRGRGGLNIVGPDGSLLGPFNAFVHAPDLGRRLLSLGGQVRFKTSLERRLSEIAICTTGAYWQSEFEFFAHGPMAIEHGIDPAVIEALRAGETPTFAHDDERIVHAVTMQLLERHRVDDALYADAVEVLGEQGMVELASTVGYYCLVSLTLNLFQVGLPDGAERSWPELP